MFCKTIVFMACLAFLGLTLVNGQSHIINDCLQPGKAPTVIYDQELSKSGSFLHTQEETVRVPNVGFTPKPITCITVTNLDSDADAGFPKILEGGVGQQYVTIDIKSQFGKGFDFRITVYYDKNATTGEINV